MNSASINEIRLKLLKLLEKHPQLTQREMKKRMGISLGKVNYCISGLVGRGLIRVERFKKNPNKTGYLYRLTPKGVEELTRLTFQFLKVRLEEYEQIRIEICKLSEQISNMLPDSIEAHSELMEKLKKIL